MHGLDDRDAVEERLARIERALERMRDLQLAPIEARSQRMSVQIERLARIECKLHTIGEIVIYAASFGLGAAVGYGVEHYSTFQGWGWPAATAAGVSAALFASWWRSDFFWHESWDKQRKRAQERARAQAGNG